MVRAKQLCCWVGLAALLLLFLICSFGVYATLKVGAAFALNAGVWDVLWILLTPSCWSKSFPSWYKSSISSTSALSRKNMDGTVGAAGSCGCDPLCHPLLLVHSSWRGTWEEFGVFLRHTLVFQPNLWVMLVVNFAVFAMSTVTRLCIKHLS